MKISIITVCYNSEKTIKDTIVSVLGQTYKNFEYILIDGLSKDNTLNIIKSFETDARIRYISEKDKGIYDAMNKGIKMATGDIVGIINADDILSDEKVFEKIVKNFDDNSDIVYGNVLYMDETLSSTIRNYVSGEKKSLSFCPAHPTMYVRKGVYDNLGTYNINYKIAADFDFMVRCNKSNVRYKYLNEYLVKMRYGGASNGLIGYINNFKECVILLYKNKIPFPFTRTVFKTIKTLKQLLLK